LVNVTMYPQYNNNKEWWNQNNVLIFISVFVYLMGIDLRVSHLALVRQALYHLSQTPSSFAFSLFYRWGLFAWAGVSLRAACVLLWSSWDYSICHNTWHPILMYSLDTEWVCVYVYVCVCEWVWTLYQRNGFQKST
jgi:hypothetical protein